MKKILSFLAVGALTFTACTSDEVVDESVTQTNAIAFNNVVKKNARAIDSDNPLTHFNVYGYYTKSGFTATPVTVFSNDEVTGSGSDWTYTGELRYWIPGASYRFFAYSCDNKALEANGKPFMTFNDQGTVSAGINDYICGNSHQDDLIYAKSASITGLQTNNDKVPLTFNHILSKVNVNFKCEFPEGYEIAISGIQFENVVNTGNYIATASATGTWTVEFDDANKILNVGAPTGRAKSKNGTTEAVDATSAEAYVIPANYAGNDISLSFKADVYNGATLALSRVFTATWAANWVIGTSYTYNVVLSGETASLEPIEFGQTTVNGWTPGTVPTNITFDASVPLN